LCRWRRQRLHGEREKNNVFAERSAKLMTAVGAPVVIFGYTGHESDPSYVFRAGRKFLLSHGAQRKKARRCCWFPNQPRRRLTGPRNSLSPPRDLAQEKWKWRAMGPDDPGIKEKMGFCDVECSRSCMTLSAASPKNFPEIYTEIAGAPSEGIRTRRLVQMGEGCRRRRPRSGCFLGGCHVARDQNRPASWRCSPGNWASIDAHFAAMKDDAFGLYEYQVAAKMSRFTPRPAARPKRTRPSSARASNSTVLHYNKLDRKIAAVKSRCSMFAGSIPVMRRTSRAQFPPTVNIRPAARGLRNRSGAQNAALAALKPGMMMGGKDSNSLQKIAMDYIDSHGKDKEGRSLGRYYIHGLKHHSDLNVHDPSGPVAPARAGQWFITIEPDLHP